MQGWLKCLVSDGMFSNERAITVHVKGNEPIEEFVPENTVRGKGEAGHVEVGIVDRDDGQWAVLPTPYRKTIPIDKGQLAPA